MAELLGAVAEEVAATGAPVRQAVDGFPAGDELAYVVIPHEYFGTADPGGLPTREQFARTIAFCVEHPGTPWFELSHTLASSAGAVVDINAAAVAESRARGTRAERFRLGYFACWDRWGGGDGERPIDALYLGASDPRRARVLAGAAASLAAMRTQLLMPPTAPKFEPRPDVLMGDRKYDRLRASKLVLNLHREHSQAFEWVRVLEAVANGAAVVSEHSSDHAPLVPGEHFVSCHAEATGVLARGLIEDPERLGSLRDGAYAFARAELPVGPEAERLVALAESLVARRPGGSAAREERFGGGEAPRPEPEPEPQPPSPAPAAAPAALSPAGQSPAFTEASPAVTVLAVDPDAEALRSVAAQALEALELLVCGGAEHVTRLLDERPWLAWSRLDSGDRTASRCARVQALAAAARAPAVLVLGAGQGLFPHGLARLTEALEQDAGARFAYGTTVVNSADGRPEGLAGEMAWELGRARAGHGAGPLVLLRGEAATFAGDGVPDLAELCLRIGLAGGRGVHVPELVGWHTATRP
jgi:hypothetical protein